MSSRALRRLQGDLDLLNSIPNADDGDGDASNESDEERNPDNLVIERKHRKKQKKKQTVNPFALLADEGQDGDEEREADEEEKEEIENTSSPAPKAAKKKKKKRKRAKETLPALKQENGENVEDEVDASVQEVNRIMGDMGLAETSQPHRQPDGREARFQSLLAIEYRHLNTENELKRKFGSRVVQADQNNRQRKRARSYQLSKKLVQPQDNWPVPIRTGLSMALKETRGTTQFFVFEHSPQYQKVQFQFQDAVESLQPQNISNLLAEHPYHIDGLIQLSEVFRMTEDMHTAAKLIERALYGSECAFHPLFNLATGTCRLSYLHPENRSFYISLFKHILNVGQRGCYRTALEFCKLLLSLDPEGDPMCVLLMIDFYALKAEENSYLIRIFNEWESCRNLSQLPNFAFTVPLAMFHQAQGKAEEEEKASAMLENSLLMFPGVLPDLLDKCGVQPDPLVASHTFFSPAALAKQPESLRQLVALYVGRCFSSWKEPTALHWLEETTHRVLKLVDAKDPRVEEYRVRGYARYRGTPRNIYRHIILSEIKDATAALPPDMANAPVLSYDPLPPPDSIISYRRPERPASAHAGGSTLSLFLRSLLPNYNPDDPEPAPQEVLEAAGGVEGEGNTGENLWRGVAILMDTMRDLLNNLRPVDPPVENRQHRDGDEDENEDIWEDD